MHNTEMNFEQEAYAMENLAAAYDNVPNVISEPKTPTIIEAEFSPTHPE